MIKRLPPMPAVERRVDNVEDWYQEVLDDEATTADQLEAFARLADSDAEFTEMIATDYLAMGTMLAEHDNTSPATIVYLLEVVSQDWREAGYVLQAIARNPKSSTEALNTVFSHGDRYAREMVVGHSNVSDEVFTRATADPRESVRHALTYDNPRVPDTVLRRLADSDPEEYIRVAATDELETRARRN